MESFLTNQYFIAFIYGYVLSGFIADLLVNRFMLYVQKRTSQSYKDMYGVSPPPGLDLKKRVFFSWAPRTIGILERIFYTSAIIFNQFALIGIWLVFKAIGEWSDIPSKYENDQSEARKSSTRIRANNFLIGTALSLLLGILGGIWFRLTLDPNFLAELIQKSYK